ncbi:MAG TPA: ISNCY family transposase [Terriglobales bacterium]|nr:ISNCY family transposase [Terriglobales bacterium]
MTQADRDRLVALKKAKKRLITQRQAAEELELSVRQVKRLIAELKRRGDKAVIHGLRGVRSPRRIADQVRQSAMEILADEQYRGFGPTLASEYLSRKHEIAVSRETLRHWMMTEGLWKAGQRKAERIPTWRARRSRFGELVQWDTSEHAWLEGRGEKLYLVAMVDDATSRALARFVRSDSTEANLGLLQTWLLRYGRMLACYTDKAGLFQTAIKTKRDQPREDKDHKPMPLTQIGRALQELNIAWIPAHSPQAKGRVERFFETAQDRLVKGMRVAGVKTLEQANAYLESEYLVWWNTNCTVEPAQPDDAHRALEKQHDLAAILSHVEYRQVRSDYTLQFARKIYGIERCDIQTGLRGSMVRIEKRRDGTLCIRFGPKYLRHRLCEPAPPAAIQLRPPEGSKTGPNAGGKSRWMEDFFRTPGPRLRQAIAISNATS